MYSFDQLYLFTREMLRGLYDPLNYCFATTTTTRSPTFYFALGGIEALNSAKTCGRIRTCHENGPLVDMTAETKRHLFFKNREEHKLAYNELKRGLEESELNFLFSKYCTKPFDGDSHIEITMKPSHGMLYSRLHGSQGLVRTAPRLTTWSQVEKLLNLVFRERAPIQLNKECLGVPAGVAAVPQHEPKPDLAQFIGRYIA